MGKREIISEQRKFNYGALFGSWLWGFCNRIKHWTVYTGFVMFILSFTSVPYMGIASIILAIYMGFIGSDLAYNYLMHIMQRQKNLPELKNVGQLYLVFFLSD